MIMEQKPKFFRPALIVLLFLTSATTLLGQNKGYSVHKEYHTDSHGKSIEIKGLEFLRISDGSSWGFIDTLGNIVIPLGKYKQLNPIDEYGMILATKKGKRGYIDINEKILIPFIYNDLSLFSKCVELAPAAIGKKQGFINRIGETVIPFEYDYDGRLAHFYEPGIAVVVKNRKYGVINSDNKSIIPFNYSKIEFRRAFETLVAWQNEKWAFFSISGERLSDFANYEILQPSVLGYLPADSKNLPILVTTNEGKKKLTETKRTIDYANANTYQRNLMISQSGAKFAFLDKNHNMIVPFGTFDYADVFGLGRKAIVAKHGKYGIIDDCGRLVLPLEFDFIERPSLYSNFSRIFLASKQNEVIIFDEDLNVIPVHKIVSYMQEPINIVVTTTNNKMGLLGFSGKLTIPFLYDTIYHGLPKPGGQVLVAKKDGYFGLISNTNELIQPFKYKYIYFLKGNPVFVDQNNKVGIIDLDGIEVIPFEYDAIYNTYYSFSALEREFPKTKNIFIVEKGGKFGTIDDQNNVIIPIIYDGLSGWVEYGPPAHHFAKLGEKYGIISFRGEEIIPIEYDYVGIPINDFIRVRKNDKYGVIFWENKVILPCEYDFLFLDIPWFGANEKDGKIVVNRQNVWSYYDLNGKLLKSNVAFQEINKKYNHNLNYDAPSNKHYDFGFKEIGGLKEKIK